MTSKGKASISPHPRPLRRGVPRLQSATRRLRHAAALAGAVALLAGAAIAQDRGDSYRDSESADDETFYSYVYLLDGDATLFAAQSDAEHEVEVNLPVLEGDRVWTARGSRLSLFLSDGTLLSAAGDTDLVLQNVLFSPDSPSQETIVRLLSGRVLLHVDGESGSLPAVDTANARVYLQSEGVYVVSANDGDWTHVIAREGFAEVVDQRGSSVVREGEELEVEGTAAPRPGSVRPRA